MHLHQENTIEDLVLIVQIACKQSMCRNIIMVKDGNSDLDKNI